MTRWLQAARQVSGAATKPTEPTQPPAMPLPEAVLSVKSVLSGGVGPVFRATCPPARKLEITPSASDPETYLARLHETGPQTYGAMASELGWGATRAWQAEARLRVAGLVSLGEHGNACPVQPSTRCDNITI